MKTNGQVWINSEKVLSMNHLTTAELGSLLILAIEQVEHGTVSKWTIRACEFSKVRAMFKSLDGERYALPWIDKIAMKRDPYSVGRE